MSGELRVPFSNNDSTVEMEVDGDREADFRITVQGHNLQGTTGFTSFYVGMAGWVLWPGRTLGPTCIPLTSARYRCQGVGAA